MNKTKYLFLTILGINESGENYFLGKGGGKHRTDAVKKG